MGVYMGIEPNDEITELSANIDDMTAEEIGFAFDRILEAGAVDVYALPAVRKEAVIKAVFKYTRTIGIREKLMSRYILKREFDSISTPSGNVCVKTVEGFGVKREKLEYDDLSAIAKKLGISIREAGEYAETFRKNKKSII